jgi:hypothetical protein
MAQVVEGLLSKCTTKTKKKKKQKDWRYSSSGRALVRPWVSSLVEQQNN